ncbi:glycogen/starch synthase [Kiritimatiellaeota bacterium B1221]|nr:glycogen/starch synthase [Kiritimatiellaeota bacterium B1221]
MKKLPKRILFVSSESRPFASTGGLADVAEALPNELNQMGVKIDRIMPLYRKVHEGQKRGGYELQRSTHTLQIPMGSETIQTEIYFTELHGTLTYFVNCEEFFDRTELYALPNREYSDNFNRFLFFQKAVVALIDALGQPYEVLHLNDWQTGMIPLLLEKGIYGTGRGGHEKTLYTIHNLAYQGLYPATNLYKTNLPGNFISQYPDLEYYGQLNLMKAGIAGATRVNTVSPTYAEEIRTEKFGCGLEGVLSNLAHPVIGIVNGVDTKAWNPETDPALPANYRLKSLSGKERCKQALVEEAGLTYKKETPLFVMISRLVDQKGITVIGQAMEQLMGLPLQFILLGSGQEIYHKWIQDWNQRWPEKFKGILGYDSELSHRMEAGADFFFMPSEFEPCGLNQLYSLRYGTIPVVNPTGGLKDTVTDVRQNPAHGTGLLMNSYTPEALLNCIQEGISLFHHKQQFRQVRQRGMAQDVTWTRTAQEYLDLYRDLI